MSCPASCLASRPASNLASCLVALAVAFTVSAAPACAQGTEPIPDPIGGGVDPIRVPFRELAALPDVNGVAARMMLLVDEPVTRRLFVNDMQGPLYTVSYDGGSVVEYLDLDDPRWGVAVQAQGRERGFQSFALHPQFAEPGAPGAGRFYTWTDSENTAPAADFTPGGGQASHHTVLHEWRARNPSAPTYDGDAPRELLRIEQPFANHNGGRAAFSPLARPGSPDFGLLYVNLADGGSGGDPIGNAQRLSSPFGKILRIDPLGTDGANGEYGIPASNPFAADGDDATLGEVYAYGLRNPQHLAWDPATGRMFVTDIGQGMVEELNVVTPGANFGWNQWEGSFRFQGGRAGVTTEGARGDARVTYPVAEYDHVDPLLLQRAAVTGLAVVRGEALPQLDGAVLFGDLPSGELFAISADHPPAGGQSGIRRVVLDHGGQAKSFLEILRETSAAQGREAPTRADLRFHPGADGRVYLLNKADGVIRVLGR